MVGGVSTRSVERARERKRTDPAAAHARAKAGALAKAKVTRSPPRSTDDSARHDIETGLGLYDPEAEPEPEEDWCGFCGYRVKDKRPLLHQGPAATDGRHLQ